MKVLEDHIDDQLNLDTEQSEHVQVGRSSRFLVSALMSATLIWYFSEFFFKDQNLKGPDPDQVYDLKDPTRTLKSFKMIRSGLG